MTLDSMQDRIQYQGVWANRTKMSNAAQTNAAGGTDFSDSLTQAQGAGKKRADAMGGASEPDLETEPDTRTLRQKMQDIIAKLNEKVQRGETAPSFQIGAQSFTIEQWDRLIERIDAAQEEMREQQRAKRGERLKEEAQKGIAEADWMDNRYAEDGVIQKDDDVLTVEEQLERILMDMDDPDAEAKAAEDTDGNVPGTEERESAVSELAV
ncbi:MAG: hypothetical protein K2I07_01015 [Lachnospiraceae bacterium]|nr:hypothetical protein [Lachnospiraceae bacterium]